MPLSVNSIKLEIKETALLALPISLGQLGHVLTGIADYTMLGHTRPLEMAGATFATSVFFPVMILGLGFGLGLTPLVAHANGAKDEAKLMDLFRTSVKTNLVLGIVFFGFLFWLGDHLSWFNQPIDVVDTCKAYFVLIALSIIPVMLFQSFKTFSDGLKDTTTPMVISLLSNALNIVLNYLLIFDHGSFGGMGIEGAGWATLLSRLFMVVTFMFVYWRKKRFQPFFYGVFADVRKFVHLRGILNIGLPISAYMFFEVTAFSAATFMMGWIGEDYISAHQAALSLASISFVVCMGVGNAGSIRTATFVGEKKLNNLKGVVASVVLVSLCLSLVAAFIFLLFRDRLPLVFVDANEVEIIGYASVMLLYAALFQFSDGLQVIFQGLLQGIGDVKIPSFIAITSYWCIALPLGYYLAFHTAVGYSGIWVGLTVGLTFSAVLQITRYYYSYKKLMINHF
tara:strand:+ start:7445 stop:8806 length:1362 start_codon:yes stop_codon:yes gene_type:complete